MDSRTGKKIRLGRLFDSQSGKSIIIAYAHGVLLGAQPGMVTRMQMAGMVEALRGAEGIVITPGMVRFCEESFVGRARPSLIILIHWDNINRRLDQAGYKQGTTALMKSVEESARAGADAVMTFLHIGFDDPEREARQIEMNASVNRACEDLGIVHLIESFTVRNEKLPDGRFDASLLKLHTRIAAELGADLVKTSYSGDPGAFREVVEQCPVPLLIRGGPRMDTFGDALRVAEEGIKAGAAGIVFGRNVFEQPDPERALDAFRQVVHLGRPAGQVP